MRGYRLSAVAARSSTGTPKRWTKRLASAASAARIAKKQRKARASATPSASTQVMTISRNQHAQHPLR